ncbi:hypothetical protein VPH35_073913 [Triticum aestivum]
MGRGGGRQGQATVGPSRCGQATGKREEVGDRVKEQAGPHGGSAISQLGRRSGSPLLCREQRRYLGLEPHLLCQSPAARQCLPTFSIWRYRAWWFQIGRRSQPWK